MIRVVVRRGSQVHQTPQDLRAQSMPVTRARPLSSTPTSAAAAQSLSAPGARRNR